MDFSGRAVRVETAEGTLSGTVVNIRDGNLILQAQNGVLTVPASVIRDLQVLPTLPSSTEESPIERPKEKSSPQTRLSKKQKQKKNRSTGPKSGASQDSTAWLDASAEEFDFAANLDKFDKSAIFADLERSDTTPQRERLVYNNRKLRPTEPAVDMPRATASQLVQIEGFMLGQGWTTATFHEAAGRGIAQVALKHVLTSLASNPFVLVLAGDNRSGARALAAGRILMSHGCRTAAVVLNGQDSILKGELQIFQAAGGYILSTRREIIDAVEEEGTPDLLMDALQDVGSITVTENKDDKTAAALEWLQGWAAGLHGPALLSIDRPSVSESQSPLSPTHLISCGWALTMEFPDVISRWVVDEGVPATVLETLGLSHLAIEFGSDFIRRW